MNRMITEYSLILTALYLFQIFRGRKDLFSPRVIFNAFAWLKNVPYFYQVAVDYPDYLITRYFVFKLLAFVFVNTGITIYDSLIAHKSKYSYVDKGTQRISAYYRIGILLFIIGFSVQLFVFSQSGGIIYIITHLQSRRSMMTGLHYYSLISNTFITCSVLCSEVYAIYSKSKKGRFAFYIIFILSLLGKMVYGARRPALMLLLQVLLCYHYTGNRLQLKSIFKPRYIIATVFVFFFIMVMPMMRSKTEIDIVEDPTEFVTNASSNLSGIFREFSYLTGDMFVFDYFGPNNHWWGRSYLNIFTQFIPSSIYKDKPPMDDGMYLFNLMSGLEVEPNEPTRELFIQSSIPFTLEGSLFSNFGVVGLIIGCFIVGLLYGKVYKMMVDMSYPILMILIYQEVLFVFVPSVLHTTSVLIATGTYSIILAISLRIRIKKIKYA